MATITITAQVRRRKALRDLWVIYDPLDGAHIFGSEAKAKSTLKRWEKEANNDPTDSVWEMTGPFRYSLSDT